MIQSTRWMNIQKHIGSFLLFLMICGSIGYADVKAQEAKLSWHSFDEALALANTTDKPVFVDVWAPWCGWCHKLKQEVYPSLKSDLRDQFVLTQINRDDHEKNYRYKEEKLTSFRLAQKLNAETVPAIIFLNSDGEYLLHLSGFVEAAELQPVLKYISSESYRHQTFQDFKNQIGS